MSQLIKATLSLFGCLLAAFVLSFVPTLEASPLLQAEPAVGQATDPDQTGSENNKWSAPLNLSRSGAAAEPLVVKDAQEQLHIIWRDTVKDFVYVHGAAEQWSEPVAVELPFGTRRFFPDLPTEAETPLFRPKLVAGNRDQIHAFWINDIGTLFHSQVSAAAFASFEAWSAPVQLAEGILALDVALGLDGALHLAYIRSQDTTELPAGVYYAQLSGEGAGLSFLSLLYPSAYFRSSPLDSTNVQIVASDTGHVTVAWDNRSLDKVFLAHSANRGSSWDPPTEVDGRQATDSPDADGPSNILLDASGNNVLALWRAAHESLDCKLYYSWSADGGATWQENRRLEAMQDCPESSELLTLAERDSLFITTGSGTTRLVLWNWEDQQWSDAQTQEAFDTFLSPETNKQVNLGCHQAVFAASRLYVIGCDASGGQDIWLKSRQLDAVVEWFPPAPLWELQEAVPSSEMAIESLSLAATADDRLHAFWHALNGPAINHMIWDGARWSPPRVIFTSPTAKVGEPAVTVSNSDRLLVTWGDTQTGQIYFIQARSDQALLESDWSSPVALPQPQPAASSPDISVDGSGRIYVSYAISVNDRRGVYLTWSDDNGETWAEPSQAFDGAAAGWAMVGRSHLTITGNGQIHLLWTQHTIPGGAGPIALYYVNSGDGGESWSQAAEIIAAPVSWSDIRATGEQTVHIIWKEAGESSAALRHVFSSSSGTTWSLPATLPNVDESGGPVTLSIDSAGRLSLLRTVLPAIQHWIWSGEQWSQAEDLKLDDAAAIDQLAATSFSGNRLGLLFSRQPDELNEGVGDSLFFASRPLDGAEATVETGASATVVATAPPSPQATTVSQVPLPTVTVPVVVDADDSPLPSKEEAAVATGILPAGLVVLLGFAIGLRLVRGSRH